LTTRRSRISPAGDCSNAASGNAQEKTIGIHAPADFTLKLARPGSGGGPSLFLSAK
jgi:hypothetical protein